MLCEFLSFDLWAVRREIYMGAHFKIKSGDICVV